MAIGKRVLGRIQASVALPGRARNRLLRTMGVTVGDRVFVNHGVTILGSTLTLEDDAFVNTGVLIDAAAPVRIGRAAHVAPGAVLVTATHEIGTTTRRAGEATAWPITIEAGCWIGIRAVILPGVRVAHGCIVAAGAVVTRDTEPNGLYAGCPASRLRDLPSN